MLGELLASQLEHHLLSTTDIPPGFVGDPRVGKFFREQIFIPGARYPWNEMIRRATGEPLTSKYFVEQFID
jgi:peptidyl-dipeptidase A